MQYYIMKDGTHQATTFSYENALDLVREYQKYETHYILRSAYSILFVEKEEFVKYQ